MKKKTNRDKDQYKDKPVGKLSLVSDFLPPPERLLPQEETVKITIALDEKTLRFFKLSAGKIGLKYQRMIREVLKGYARKYG